ncbi:MAG: TolC family protein [Desulfobulbaceae bacterium]|nr:TolC family protein [Desulfobulbaceae bacterium]
MKLFIFQLLLLFLTTDCMATGLADLQDLAVANRQIIEKYRENVAKAGRDQIVARSPYYPSVDLSYTANLLDHDTVMENSENSVIYGGVRWNIFSGWRDLHGLRASQWLAEAEASKLSAIKHDIRLQVALRYLAITTARANLQVALDSYDNLAQVLRNGKNRYEVGLIRKNDLLKFQVDLDNARITLQKAEAEVDRSWRFLNREVGVEINREQLAFDEFTVFPSFAALEEMEKNLLANRSELKILEKQAAVADEQIVIEKASQYPRVDVSGSYRRYEDNLFAGLGDNSQEEFRNQLVVSLNLFDGYARQARVARAGMQARTVRQDLAELQDELLTELHNLYQDYQVAIDNVAAAEAGIGQAEENLRITKLAYDEGLETEADLLSAIANLSRSRYNLATAKSAVFENYFRILRSTEGS